MCLSTLTHTHAHTVAQCNVNSCTGWQASECVSLTKHYWRAHYIRPWYEHIIKAMPGRQEQLNPTPPPPNAPPPTHQLCSLLPTSKASWEGCPSAAYISLHEVQRGLQLPADIQLKPFFIFPITGSASTALLLLPLSFHNYSKHPSN